MVSKKFLINFKNQTWIFSFFVLLLLSGCGSKDEKIVVSSENATENVKEIKESISGPTRDKMISDLYMLQRKLANYSIEDAKKLMATQYEYGNEAEKRKDEWANKYAMEHRIGTKAIDDLAEYGSFGKLDVISPSWYKDLQREKTKTNLYADDKYWYAMTYEKISVVAYWNGNNFVFSVTKGLKDEISTDN